MKILLHTHWELSVRPAGAERYTDNAVQYLQKQGHEFRYLLRNDVQTMVGGAQQYVGASDVPCYIENPDGSGYKEHYDWCDVVWSHLVMSKKAIMLGKEFDKAVVIVLHSDNQGLDLDMDDVALLVYNAEWVS